MPCVPCGTAPYLSHGAHSQSGRTSDRKGAGYILDHVTESSNTAPESPFPPRSQNRPPNKRGKVLAVGAVATFVVVIALGVLWWLVWRPSTVSFDAVAESCKLIDINVAIEESGIRDQLSTVTSSAGAVGETLTRQVEDALVGLPVELVHVVVSEDNSSLTISGDTFTVVSLDNNLDGLGSAMVRDAQLFALADCVNSKLGSPDSVGEMMRSTNTVSGTLEAEDGKYNVRWTYTMASGLNAAYAR